jgi:hypothetical protein
MEEEKGFYKLEIGARRNVLLFATHLESKDFVLDVFLKDTYTYPVDGWTYYDNLSEACLSYNADEEEARQRLFPNEDEIFTELV